MDHKDAVRLKATERYLLNELDPDQLDQFEEHLFDCPDCALDLRAAAMFVEQGKNILAEPVTARELSTTQPSKNWFAWLRPTFVVPALAALLLIVGYQNLVSIPHIKEAVNQPRLLPWASVNVGTYGDENQEIVSNAGKGFLLFVRIPPDSNYSSYTANLFGPTGKLEWALPVPAKTTSDQWPVAVPGGNLEDGTYSLSVQGTTSSGQTREVGRTSFHLQVQH
jgi:Putative zinc-finger